MALTRYDPDNCPCPSDCPRRQNCKACIQFHHKRHELTYCEFLYEKNRAAAGAKVEPPVIRTGREIRLMSYGLCAG
ncbi:MAG: hypothetical protein JXQ29_11045 [Planctomycetes bacterium]|nr:hypothetical protein [Planctomycetota bacterium]